MSILPGVFLEFCVGFFGCREGVRFFAVMDADYQIGRVDDNIFCGGNKRS